MIISIYHKTETSANNMLAIFLTKQPVYKFLKSKDKADSLEGIITKGECLSAQGHDGYNAEFYKKKMLVRLAPVFTKFSK